MPGAAIRIELGGMMKPLDPPAPFAANGIHTTGSIGSLAEVLESAFMKPRGKKSASLAPHPLLSAS